MTEDQQFALASLFAASVSFGSEIKYIAERLNELFPENEDWRPYFQGHCPECGIPNPAYPPESCHYYEDITCEPCLDTVYGQRRSVGPQNVSPIFKDEY